MEPRTEKQSPHTAAMQPRFADWKAGEIHGGYQITEIVSDCLLGSFYRAESVSGGMESVLLFVLPPELCRLQRNLLERSQGLQRKLLVVHSRHLLPMEEVLQIEDRIVWVYGDTGGRSLTHLVCERYESGGQLSEAEVKKLMDGIASAVQAARTERIGHYFLAPDFVFIDAKGEVQVGGFGLFELIDYSNFEIFVSGAIIPIQDAEYLRIRFNAIEILSPEIRNLKRVDPRSDLYGIGMCVYFALAGHKPVRQWVLPTNVRTDINPGWDLLLSHCLEQNVNRRFATVQELRADLARLDKLTATPRAQSGRLMRRLEIIPLPAKFEQKYSLRTLFYMRLCMLGLMGAVTVFTASLLVLIILDEESADKEVPVARWLLPPREGNYHLKTSSWPVSVKVSGRAAAEWTLKSSELRMQLPNGTYQFVVESPYTITRRFNAEAGVEQQIQVLQLPWQLGKVHIETLPSAELWTRHAESGLETFIENVPEDGVLALEDRLIVGEYQFVLRKTGYYDIVLENQTVLPDQIWEWKGEPEPRPGMVHLAGVDDTVSVWINGKLLEPGSVAYAAEKYEPEYEIEVRRSGYLPWVETVPLQPGEDYRVQVPELEIATGRLFIEWRLPSGEIAGSYQSEAEWQLQPEKSEHGLLMEGPGFPDQKELAVGVWRLKAVGDAFEPVTRLVVIEAQRETRETVQLERRKATLDLTEFDLASAVVEINGNRVGGNRSTFRLEPLKQYQIVVRIEDYLPEEITWTPEVGEVKKMDWNRRPLPGPEMGEDWQMHVYDLSFSWLDAGSFRMGSRMEEELRLPNEGPETYTRITYGFWMGRYEVRQSEYEAIMVVNPSQFRGADLPVDSVSWQEALVFAEKLTEFERDAGRLPEGWVYRLPTEAEWEFACRAGTDGAFWFGNTADPSKGNFKGNYPRGYAATAEFDRNLYGTVPVGSYSPNAAGLYDMHGNVREWTLDNWLDRLPGNTTEDPHRSDYGNSRAVRGGSWNDSAHHARSAAREGIRATAKRDYIGFRIVLAPQL